MTRGTRSSRRPPWNERPSGVRTSGRSGRTGHRIWLPGLLALPLLAGCQDPSGTTGPQVPSPRPQLSLQEAEVSRANTEFGLGLLTQVLSGEAEPNVLLSPLSASMALGMTMNGAVGETYDAMRSTLGFAGVSESEVNAAYRGLIDYLRTGSTRVEFELANSAWYEESFPVHAAFLESARDHFDADVRPLDFLDPASPGVISAWAEARTGGRIRDLVEEIDPLEKLFLVNAVYFKAPWALPFNPDATSPGAFRTLDGRVVDVPLMTLDGPVHHLSDGSVEAVELIYADSTFSMLVFAPAAGRSLDDLGSVLTSSGIEALTGALASSRILLTLPKFSFEYDVTLDPALDRMGMGIAFDPWASDFTRIADVDDLHITRVTQKAFIDVHELGTEAAAATSVGVGVTSMPPQIRFDRPFYLAIRDRSSGTLLFLGRVGDPSS